MAKIIKTSICAYCGCACKLNFIFEDGKLVSTQPVSNDYISRGKPCIKGLSLHESLQTNRIDSPMIKRNGKFENVTWSEAYEYIYENLKGLNRDEVYFTGSGEFTNEANYLMSKFARLSFKTNNIDCCARLCHAATGTAFKEMFGISAIPEYDFTDLEERDLYLMIGTDPKDDYPVMYHRIKEAKDNGAKIVVIDVGPSSTSKDADLILKISSDGIIPLLANLIKKIVIKKDFTKDAKLIDGFDDFYKSVVEIAEENSLYTANLNPGEFETLYNILNYAKKPAILYGMGATQQEIGTQNVKIISSLALLLNAVLYSNRGKVNVQGAGDMGSCPEFAPADGCAKDIEKYWKINIDTEQTFTSHKGKPITVGMYDDEVKAFWIMGMNPAHSMPDLNKLHSVLKNKFVVFQGHHLGKTSEFADVILPTTMLPEENGTITNGERRVRQVFSIGHNPQIKPNWKIITEIAKYFGLEKTFQYYSVEDIWKEIKAVIPAYSKLDDLKIKEEGDLADKSRKFTKFPKIKYKRNYFEKDNGFPFTLTTARTQFHFCSGEGTRNSAILMKLDPKALALLNSFDARSIGVTTGDLIKIISSVGEIEVEVKIDDMVGEKIVVLPYHFEKVLVNKLTPLVLDPESFTPSYKEVAVRIEKVK